MCVYHDTSQILGCRFHLPTPPVDVAMLCRTQRPESEVKFGTDAKKNQHSYLRK